VFLAFLEQSETTRVGIKHDFCMGIFSNHQFDPILHFDPGKTLVKSEKLMAIKGNNYLDDIILSDGLLR